MIVSNTKTKNSTSLFLNRGITALFLFLLCLNSYAQTSFEEANEAYAAGNYAEAAEAYETLLSDAPNATLYYNAGNAYFKQGELAKSILNYERALRLEPGHKDAKFNLAFAQSRITDNIVEHDFFLSTWVKSVRNTLSEHSWTILSICFFVLFLTGILFFLLSREIWVRKTAFHIGWLALLFCIVAGLNAGSLHKRDTLRNEAIITQGIVNAKSSPDRSGTDLFTLHEGTKVTIREVIGNWVNVHVGPNEGWIPSKDLERI